MTYLNLTKPDGRQVGTLDDQFLAAFDRITDVSRQQSFTARVTKISARSIKIAISPNGPYPKYDVLSRTTKSTNGLDIMAGHFGSDGARSVLGS